jgi:hypothetical protein
MAYRVVIADGPAAGWEYVTMVPPDPIIAVAPIAGRFVRVIAGVSEPWPDQADYERATLPAASEDDVTVEYRMRA